MLTVFEVKKEISVGGQRKFISKWKKAKIMRKLLLLMVVVSFGWLPARAENKYPKAEIFGGFSILSVGWGGPSSSDREQMFGWQASANANVHRNVGLVADFGGHYKTVEGTKVRVYEYLFGPRFNVRTKGATLFADTLFGGVHSGVHWVAGSQSGTSSDNAFLMGFGGGVDVNAGSRVAVRLFQIDWLPNHSNGEWSKKEFRVGFGIVFKVGGRS